MTIFYNKNTMERVELDPRQGISPNFVSTPPPEGTIGWAPGTGWYTEETNPYKQSLEQVHQSVLSAALNQSDELTKSYRLSFSETERETWPYQRAEVDAFLVDATAPTPVLDSIAVSRGISREEMLKKTVAKVQVFIPLSCAIIGHQQRIEDEVKAIMLSEKTDDEKIAALKMIDTEFKQP